MENGTSRVKRTYWNYLASHQNFQVTAIISSHPTHIRPVAAIYRLHRQIMKYPIKSQILC